MIDFFKIDNSQDLFGKFSGSWLTTFGLTAVAPSIDIFYPLISQIVLICTVQLVALFVDYARYKWLNQRKKDTIKEITDQIEANKHD